VSCSEPIKVFEGHEVMDIILVYIILICLGLILINLFVPVYVKRDTILYSLYAGCGNTILDDINILLFIQCETNSNNRMALSSWVVLDTF